MSEPVWKLAARADLLSIVDHISDDNPEAALALLGEIEGRVGNLVHNPRSGRPGRVPGTRELVVHPNYVVVYTEAGARLTVLRVLHAARQWP